MSDTYFGSTQRALSRCGQMPRKLRQLAAEWPVHIVQRGSDRMTCFHEDGDYLVYMALLRDGARTSGCAVHAFCLMTNHVHLLLTPGRTYACSTLMKSLAQRYSYYFNRKYGRTGPLWEGRFRSCAIEAEQYLLACYRYVEMNPVRARMVSHAGAYPWSSYAINAGIRKDSLIVPHAEFLVIGVPAYIRMIGEPVSQEQLATIRESTSGGHPLGANGPRRGKVGRPRSREINKPVSDTDLFSGGGVS